MSNLEISLAVSNYDRVLPLIDGEIKADGIDLEYVGMPGAVPRVFYDQIKFSRYDVSEMSISSFLRIRAKGWPYRMLPVFHNRSFSYTEIVVRGDSGISVGKPEQLKGKKIGIGDYQQSVGLWSRGILSDEFDVHPEDMVWYQERGEKYSHTGASGGFSFPTGVSLHYATKDLGAMFRDKELDAAISFRIPSGSGLDRVRNADLADQSQLVRLFQDPRAEAIRYYQKEGIFPPHHVTVIRESILNDHPWVATSLMDAFERAKVIAITRIREQTPTLIIFGNQQLRELDSVFGPDPFVYGIASNEKSIRTAQRYSVEQGLTTREQPWDELFPEEIMISEERLSSSSTSH
jgi:4,5-dihydroxyphthalate decarboxylase